jgi:hypothetical protein
LFRVLPLHTKSQRIVVTFGARAFLALAVLAVFGSLQLRALLRTVPDRLPGDRRAVRPRWRSRVNAVILPGVVVLALIASMKARLQWSDRGIEEQKRNCREQNGGRNK